MKELKKLSLSNMQGKLSRKEMKTIMAGSGVGCPPNSCGNGGTCYFWMSGLESGCNCFASNRKISGTC